MGGLGWVGMSGNWGVGWEGGVGTYAVASTPRVRPGRVEGRWRASRPEPSWTRRASLREWWMVDGGVLQSVEPLRVELVGAQP